MKAAELMTRHVVTVRKSAYIDQAVRLMLQRGISGLPVVDSEDKLVGIITEGDFLRRSEIGTERHRSRWITLLLSSGRLAAEYVHAHARKVAEVMTTEVQTISEDTPIGEIVRIMEEHRVKRLPVLRDSVIVGIVSRADVLRAFVRSADDVPAASESDANIRRYVIDEIAKQPWSPRATVTVAVRNGLVHLSGMTFDDRERQALRVLAEDAPSVKGVRDDLRVIEPISGIAIY